MYMRQRQAWFGENSVSLKVALPHLPLSTGSVTGQVMIPKISIIPIDLPVQFKRVQFPTKLAFVISIMGQILKVFGVNLLKSCFPFCLLKNHE